MARDNFGNDVLSKAALNQGMNDYAIVVYRHAIAAFLMAPFAAIIEKKVRPKMTIPIFIKIMVLGILEAVLEQNLYYVGMKYTTATFVAAMYNIIPAITFLMAWILRLEKVNLRSIRSHAKIICTLATDSGAMVMVLMKGPVLELFSTEARINSHETGTDFHDTIKGGLMICAGCFSFVCFMILQGIVCSGLAYYIQGVVINDRGPIFPTAFGPTMSGDCSHNVIFHSGRAIVPWKSNWCYYHNLGTVFCAMG
ncbi:eukaryotic peptide chain release factor subunit 1-3-like [Hibiscus syriacus]|uniref:WAT1-related protein n=1 Tax=Hibiscus syriacus TaxID=106335 RepID=A0A6A3CF01_HIBSY|nr:eukaryotic peptide chain release factor subunit 1-3-like [Hibiscus syriacus]